LVWSSIALLVVTTIIISHGLASGPIIFLIGHDPLTNIAPIRAYFFIRIFASAPHPRADFSWISHVSTPKSASETTTGYVLSSVAGFYARSSPFPESDYAFCFTFSWHYVYSKLSKVQNPLRSIDLARFSWGHADDIKKLLFALLNHVVYLTNYISKWRLLMAKKTVKSNYQKKLRKKI
jgi:hypothetical protein